MSRQSATDWSIDWWKKRHDQVYFPVMEQHLDWKVYEAPPAYLVEMAQPTKEDHCLEIGCGYGQWLVPLSKMVASVAGIDIHQILADKAAEKFREHGCSNCQFVLSDGKTIPYLDESFSLIYSISVFQHVPRECVRGYFREAARVLEPGGRVLFQFRHADNDGPYAIDIGVNHDRSGQDFSVGWTVEEVMTEAARVGWTARTVTGGNAILMLGRRFIGGNT